jgi:hypothetical protein
MFCKCKRSKATPHNRSCKCRRHVPVCLQRTGLSIDMCRVTKGSHTEHLYLIHTNVKTILNTLSSLAISIIFRFLYNVENVYFFYSSPVFLNYFVAAVYPFKLAYNVNLLRTSRSFG